MLDEVVRVVGMGSRTDILWYPEVRDRSTVVRGGKVAASRRMGGKFAAFQEGLRGFKRLVHLS